MHSAMGDHDEKVVDDESASLIVRGTSPLSDAQEKALALLPILPCILSLTGASIVIYRILLKTKKRTPYLRILLGMSVFGILAVASFLMQPFLLPQETSHRVWASGNDATCTFLGFMFQLSISMVLYYGSLSFYFLAVVRYDVTDQQFARRFEPWIHCITIGFPLITASVGVGLGVYAEHDLGPVCWVSDYPRGCEMDADITCLSPLIGWIFGGGIMVLTLIAIIINNSLIFRHVRTTNRRTSASTLRPQNSSRKERAVAVQGALYVTTGIFCYLPTVLLRAIEAVQPDYLGGSPEGRLYVLFVLQALFLPSQNSIITLIFIRPRYKKCRSACPRRSRLWALHYALLGDKIRLITSSTRRATISASRSHFFNETSFSASPLHDPSISARGIGPPQQNEKKDEEESTTNHDSFER